MFLSLTREDLLAKVRNRRESHDEIISEPQLFEQYCRREKLQMSQITRLRQELWLQNYTAVPLPHSTAGAGDRDD